MTTLTREAAKELLATAKVHGTLWEESFSQGEAVARLDELLKDGT